MKLAVLFSLLFPLILMANQNIDEERLHDQYKYDLLDFMIPEVCLNVNASECEEQKKILVDAFIEILDLKIFSDIEISLLMNDFPYNDMSAADQIRLKYYLSDSGFAGSVAVLKPQLKLITLRDRLTACVYLGYQCEKEMLIQKMPDAAMLHDLLVNTPEAQTYKNGRYAKGFRLFMLCRQNREYPCRSFIKNTKGEFVKNSDGSVWSLPTLALSKKGRPSSQTDGQTPTGVMTIDGVMPEADKTLSFGKFRRMILNFISSSEGEKNHMDLLPDSSQGADWWQQAVIARDIGRNSFRLHGTGVRNFNSRSTYYPHVPTRGCISTLEGKYNGVEYTDQRHILDILMLASKLEPIYNNETKLRGLLYVVNIDDQDKAVTTDDLMAIINYSKDN